MRRWKTFSSTCKCRQDDLTRISHQYAWRKTETYVSSNCDVPNPEFIAITQYAGCVHCVHPPAYNRQSLPLRKQGGRLCAQPCGRLSPCKLSVLTICPSTIATAMLSVAGTRWQHKSARSRFGRPQDALCAMDGVHLKSSAIIASIGEICGLNPSAPPHI